MDDRLRLRNLAEQWHEAACRPEMNERKKLWSALHGLKKTRPMILIETGYINHYVPEDMLECTDPFLRKLEYYMLDKLLHVNEIGDDVVLEDFFRIGWQMEQPSYGVDILQKESGEKGLAYVFEHVIKEPEDAKRLVKRTFHVDKEKSIKLKEYLEDIFGDILPVKLVNYSFMDEEGCYDWVGNYFFGLTWQLHRFIGLDQMLYWYYDYPEAMHELMQYMVDDRLRMFRELEQSGCVNSNSDNQVGGPCFYGYCDDLPYYEGTGSLSQNWAWCESQESSSISPAMFEEFILPYLAQLSGHFGKIYYGCCEPLHDRLELIENQIKNLRAVSVSMWNDFPRIAEIIGQKYVYSRKPAPPPLSGHNVDWDEARKDILLTKNTAGECHVEFLFRDLYEIAGDRKRLAQWVELTKSIYDM